MLKTIINKIIKFFNTELDNDLENYTTIGKGVEIAGSITNGKLFIDGTFIPSKDADFQKLQISSTGVFISENEKNVFNTEYLEIAGNFTGNIIATNIKILSGATITGTLSYSGNFLSEINTTINANIKKIEA